MENERNFRVLLPPPRKIPFSLAVHLLLSKFISGIAVITAVLILPVLLVLWTRGERHIIFLVCGAIALLGGFFLLVSEIKAGLGYIKQFKEGIFVSAKLINVSIESHERRDRQVATRVLFFEYEYRGKSYSYEHRQVQSVSQNSKLLEDEVSEPFLIYPGAPEKPLPVDSFQAKIIVDADGVIRMRKPALGYTHLLLTLLGTAGVILEIYFFLLKK